MTLFGINFAIGVATGIILEFEFGTNWSNYSWIVGDIFGAPLAVEGIMAFFLESTFIAVMFFGWNKVSKKFHLLSTWLVAIGSNLSALWILVANAWMQSPVGMQFNPDTARSEMQNFREVLFSPVAINKFFHTVTTAYIVGALFVAGISAWYLLKNRHSIFAKKSMKIAAVFGLLSALLVAFTGDGSAYQVAQKQPVKLAAMEGLYNGQNGAGLIVFGILNSAKKPGDAQDEYLFKLEIPKALSLLTNRNAGSFVPGIDDLVFGNPEKNIASATEKIQQGKLAIKALAIYKNAKRTGNKFTEVAAQLAFKENYNHIGYGYLNDPRDIVPNVPVVFYSFHVMVALGGFFILLFAIILFLLYRKKIEKFRLILWLAVLSIPLGYLASQLGWVVAEVGRQPWAIQDILPTAKATSHLDTGNVQTTFWIFAVLFSVLLIAEIKIMLKQIKIGPRE